MHVISLTTIPQRIPHTKDTILSLINQDVNIPVYVHIPYYCKRFSQRMDGQAIPPWMTDNDVVSVFFVEDNGPGTKLTGSLPLADHIITADDDMIYPTDWASGLMAAFDGTTAIGYRGRKGVCGDYRGSTIYGGNKPAECIKEPVEVDILTGVEGCMYRSDWFKTFKPAGYPQPAFFNDDVQISGHLSEIGIKRVIIPGGHASDDKSRWINRLSEINTRDGLTDKSIKEYTWRS